MSDTGRKHTRRHTHLNICGAVTAIEICIQAEYCIQLSTVHLMKQVKFVYVDLNHEFAKKKSPSETNTLHSDAGVHPHKSEVR